MTYFFSIWICAIRASAATWAYVRHKNWSVTSAVTELPRARLFTIGVDGLAIAGSTLPTEQASELIASGRLEEMLVYIRSIAASPIILLDLPPLLVTDEALLVAPRVDAVALVVAEGRTRRDTLVRAKQLLSEFTMAGVILNRSSERHGADKYYGYHYREDQFLTAPASGNRPHSRPLGLSRQSADACCCMTKVCPVGRLGEPVRFVVLGS